MNTEKMQNETRVSAGPREGMSIQDAISSSIAMVINWVMVLPAEIINDYSAMNWEPVRILMQIKEVTGIVFPLLLLSFLYKKKRSLVILSIIQLVLLIYMYINMVGVGEQARLIGETNVSVFYLAYLKYIIVIVLLSSVIQGLSYIYKSKRGVAN